MSLEGPRFCYQMQEEVLDYVYQISGLNTPDRKYLCACVCVAPTAILPTHSRLKTTLKHNK
jgi:hypothetical protein